MERGRSSKMPLGEFPFADEASRANAMALFITPEIPTRDPFLGNIPMGLVDAPQAGSGKSLLVSVVSRKRPRAARQR